MSTNVFSSKRELSKVAIRCEITRLRISNVPDVENARMIRSCKCVFEEIRDSGCFINIL